MEQIAMTGVVADVVAAFEHGETLVKKLQEKRAQRGVPLPPSSLEQSFVRGPRAIREAYETGYETYGNAFKVENDRIALDALKDILINLQSALFQHLFTAQEDDAMLDFTVVINAATMARVKSVHVLNEMFMRMAEAPQGGMGSPISPVQPTAGAQPSQQTSPVQDSSFVSPIPGMSWNGLVYTSKAENMGRTIDSMGAPLTGTVSAGSQFQPNQAAVAMGSNTSHSYSSSNATNFTIQAEEVDLARFPPPPNKPSFRNVFSKSKPQSNPSHDDLKGNAIGLQRHNSASSDGKSIYGSSSGASLLSGLSPEGTSHPQMASPPGKGTPNYKGHKIPFNESPPAEYRKRLNNRPKDKRAVTYDPSTSHSLPALRESRSNLRKFSLLGGSKAPKEDFAGFCEGAYLMQIGQEGMKLRNQSVSMTGQNNYWACSNSKCCFEGHALLKKEEHKKAFGFDDDILESHGIRYRWSFLAKSHTTVSNSKAGFEYQCVFCIGRGTPPFRVKGNRKFLEHVATHQGQMPNQYRMPRFSYVVGRSASAWENFDVNLPAATAMELETMETPTELEALEPDLPEMEVPLDHPVHSMRVRRATDGHNNASDSGLGIRISTETRPGILDGQYQRPCVNSYPTEHGRSNPAGTEVDSQGISTDHRQFGSNNLTDMHHKEKEELEDTPIEQSWTHVTDSIQSLHPAPLFTRGAVFTGSETQKERRPPQEECFRHNQHQTILTRSPQSDEPEDLDINPYNPHDEEANSAVPGRIQRHNSFRKHRAAHEIESTQGSMVGPEAPHMLSTPELLHPGIKWMD